MQITNKTFLGVHTRSTLPSFQRSATHWICPCSMEPLQEERYIYHWECTETRYKDGTGSITFSIRRKIKNKKNKVTYSALCLFKSHQTNSHLGQVTPFLVKSPYIWMKNDYSEGGGLRVLRTYCGTIISTLLLYNHVSFWVVNYMLINI